MKKNIACIILIALLGITVSASIAQQNQNVPKTDTEVEALQKRVTELEGKLQTVENVEKMELAAKLAEAQAKLSEAEAKLIGTKFGKLKLELKDYNQQWLRNWIFIILGILSVVGFALWKRLTSKMDDLVVDGIEKRLDGFKEAVGKVNILEKEHAVSVLEDFQRGYSIELKYHPERIKALLDEVLLEVFRDKTRDFGIRWTAVDVLAARKFPQLVSPCAKFPKFYC